ncbi:hypothetical protein EJF36_04890 [Bacillus sp. HMF5848]|uniref:fluoroquinolone export ABC transporter permease subunit n=1 Tax=Bacillus sp. HMF5848 TaxID=2495421 RepID=UPI000F782416|nr:hypothetical protein [Bacillus sp. HMF5848]RSK26244.1 hypothetical protein EJF36_04890 [Bacillus sp. HMF5848]
MRFLHVVGMDIRFQLRQGFYIAYAFVSAFYIGILFFLPDVIKEELSTVIIFTDPAVLGFFFIGGIVLLERAQAIFDPLFVTPLHVHEYLISKVLSLSLLAVITSLLIMFSSHGGDIQVVPLMVSVLLSSIFFTLLGLILAVRVQSVNAFLYTSPIFVVVFFVPIIQYFGGPELWLYYLLPSQAALLLIEGSFHVLQLNVYVYAILTLVAWIILAYVWAYHSFYRYIVLGVGGRSS